MSTSDRDVFLDFIAELHRAVHAVGLYLDGAVEGAVSQPEALVVLHLYLKGSSTINDVHRAFLHRRSTLTSVVDRLEARRIVRRAAAAADRRSVEIALTAAGRKLGERIAAALEELHASVPRVRTADSALVHAVAEEAERRRPGG